MKLFSRHLLTSLCLAAAGLLLGKAAFAAAEPPKPPAVLPEVIVLATDPTALTDASSGAFTVIRTGSLDAKLVLKYTVSGTGVNGTDYTGADGQKLDDTVTIPEKYAAQDIVILPKVNLDKRGNKTVILTLAKDAAYEIGRNGKATVHLVDDTYNDKPPAVTLSVTGGTVGPDGNQTFTIPTTVKLTAEATDPDDKVVKVSFYANDLFLGSATEAPFTFAWENPRAGQYDLFARATDQFGKSALSDPIPIVVTANLPKVKIISPTDAPIPPGSDVRIAAEVTPGAGPITKVVIYGDGRALATLTAAPYETTWTKVPPGQHKVTVRAIDELGQIGSASVTFKAENKAPVVTLTAPKDGATFTAPATITLTAEASDPENQAIQRVSFYANGRLLGSVAKAPYAFEWKNVRAGNYQLQASATDQAGARAVSDKVKIVVSR